MRTWKDEEYEAFQRRLLADIGRGFVNAIRQYGPPIALVILGFALGWL